MKTIEKEAVGLFNRIMETEFTFTIINPGTHEEVKRNIFKRINTGGEPLTPQEMRNALYAGKASALLKKLAESKAFIDVTEKTISPKRMDDKEWVLGLLAFMVRPYYTFSKAVSVDDWLSDTMIILNAMLDDTIDGLDKAIKSRSINISAINRLELEEIEHKFYLAIERSLHIFGKHTFRASSGGMRRTRLNRRLFESWGVLLSELTDDEFNRLCGNHKLFTTEYQRLLKNASFKQAISKHGMEPVGVKRRFEAFAKLIKKYSRNENQGSAS